MSNTVRRHRLGVFPATYHQRGVETSTESADLGRNLITAEEGDPTKKFGTRMTFFVEAMKSKTLPESLSQPEFVVMRKLADRGSLTPPPFPPLLPSPPLAALED